MEKVLVSGVNGFVGKHLARALSETGCEIGGISREPAPNPEIAGLLGEYFVCDLNDTSKVNQLDLSAYDTFISLAGLANVGKSYDSPELYKQVNVAVLANVCQRFVDLKISPRIIAVSTGAVYDSTQTLPLSESSPLIKEGSPYAFSKIAMEESVKKFREQGLPECVIVRPFNHIGPGQGPGFLLPDLYQRIVDCLKTPNPELHAGALATRRDYTDVRDVVKAYVALAAAPTLDHPIYNICSGQSVEGNQILELLLEAMGQTGKIKILRDGVALRPNDPKDIYGNNQRLKAQTGWQPTIKLVQTIEDFVAAQKS